LRSMALAAVTEAPRRRTARRLFSMKGPVVVV
jgi:hypothetical protein